MSEQWVHEMRQKMAGYKKTAPEVSWNKLDQALASNRTHLIRQVWNRRISAAAVLLLLLGAGYWSLLHDGAGNSPQKAPSAVDQPLSARIRKNDGCVFIQQQSKYSVPVTLTQIAMDIHRAGVPVQESDNFNLVSTVKKDTVDSEAAEKKELSHVVEEKRTKEPARSAIYPTIPTSQYHHKNIGNRLTANVYLSSTMADSHEEIVNHEGTYVPTGDSIEPSQTQHNDQLVHHHKPIRLGISLRYKLYDKWSIESGLTFTHLSYEIAKTKDGKATVTEQRYCYAGLSLNISYDLWKRRDLRLYITTGGRIEKRLETSLWQYSLNAAVGADYELTNSFSIYLEPSLGYYFPDGSSMPILYHNNPTIFNLSAGIRFNLQ